MEFVQERITTLHDFGLVDPSAPTDRAAVVVPLTEREYASLAAERVLTKLARVDPDRVVIPLRATPSQVGDVVSWLDGFELDATVLWCTAPRVESHLADAGFAADAGKGRDVWLGLGLATRSEYVVVHDADAKTYTASHVSRLLAPLDFGFEFVKGYYARVESDRLYGRLFRLFVSPLLHTIREKRDAPILAYLLAFRYALAGEFAGTGSLVRRLRIHPDWGLEIGTLGDAFEHAGFEGTAQVDLGIHQHDHRSIGGPEGLGSMAREVAVALFHVLEDRDVVPDYDTLPTRYRATASRLVDQYAADARFNDLSYDPTAEREQVETYATQLKPPAADRRLPSWEETDLDPARLRSLSQAALDDVTES